MAKVLAGLADSRGGLRILDTAAKVLWIDQERQLRAARVCELLEQSGIRVKTLIPNEIEERAIQEGALIVIDADNALAVNNLIQRVPQVRGVRILARLEDPYASVPGVVGVLDRKEGPELTRARILQWLAGPRESQMELQSEPEWRRALIGTSRPMRKVAEVIRLVGPRRCTVLISGETGTGKEVAARAIHAAGPRVDGPFVALNCSAFPAALLEAELFGHTRGAFTGATQIRTGRFEEADGGTLFLDEIGDMPLELQAKLLRVLQEREVQKLGSSETVRVDARFVAATNCDLRAKVRRGEFREDLFYRLNVVPLEMPPLRARLADVRALAGHFLEKVCDEEQIAMKRFTPEALGALESYEWPGNVRQLENAIASAAILAEQRPYLDSDDFPHVMQFEDACDPDVLGPVALPEHGLDFAKTVETLERNLLSQALKKTNGNKKAAAEMLRLKRTTLSAKVRVLELGEGAA